jgi:AraC-like DNA-binding protein
MLYKLHLPKFPLSQFVENIWYYDGHHAGHSREKILPDGAIELIIDLDAWPKKIFEDENTTERFRTVNKAWISGERTKYIVIGADNVHMIGIRFKPGGAYPFFGFPISELSEYVTELDLIWGRSLYHIRDELLEIDSPERKLLRFEAFLLEQTKRSLEQNKSIAFAIHKLQHSPQFLAIRDLASHIGITQKHLISQFEKIVGLRPKSFARVAKFHKVLQAIEKTQKVEWTSIAYECGYYDQAHFIKEFHNFSGVNPSAYLTQRGDYLGYIPID